MGSGQAGVYIDLDYLSEIDYKPQLLLFPEGTDFNKYSKKKSDEFAGNNNKRPYEYVLHPRTTGFTFLVDHMRKDRMLDAVHDVTVAYPKNIPHNELDILQGNFPEEIHFHVERYDQALLPQSEGGLQKWCEELWQQKEQRLQSFYQNKTFGEEPVLKNFRMELRVMILFWLSLHVVWAIMLVWSSVARWYFFFFLVWYNFAYYYFGGMDVVEMKIHEWWKARRGSSPMTSKPTEKINGTSILNNAVKR